MSDAVNSNVQVSGATPLGTLIAKMIIDVVDNDESIQSLGFLFKHSAFIIIVKISLLSLSLTSATTI